MPEAAVLVADEPVLLRRGMTSADYFAGEETMTLHNLIDGELYRMPSRKRPQHDAVATLLGNLADFADAQGGDVILSPMDCELADGTVLQPDLGYIIPERAGIYTDIVHGPPDIVIEVISPGSRRFQRERKMAVYARFGVPEHGSSILRTARSPSSKTRTELGRERPRSRSVRPSPRASSM